MEINFNEYERENKRVSFYNYLRFYNINLILNNNLFDPCEYELYNYNQLIDNAKKDYIEENKEELKNLICENIMESDIYNIWDDIEEIKENVIEDFIKENEENIIDYLNYNYCEVFQWFIINENDINFLMALNCPIYYNYDKDLYLLGVTHWGTGWDYCLTPIKIIDNNIDVSQVVNLLDDIRSYL